MQLISEVNVSTLDIVRSRTSAGRDSGPRLPDCLFGVRAPEPM
jgi:hypothetical protein